VHKQSRLNQANISITATRWCNRRCTHCYIDPSELANPVEMEEGVFRGIFDRVRDLVALDRGLEEVEWEIIGGEITKMPVEFWRRNLPFALEQCRDFNAQLKTPGSVNVLSNLIFSDQRRRADYIDLFNQYGDWPEMCVYTSWEPETNRFGKRDKLMPAWRETVSALKVRQKILDVILTKTTVELGPDYLLEQFLPLGVTDFSIKMISPYGSGKAFWQPNMISFAQMSDYLCRLFEIAPKGITFTPADEMTSAMFRGTSYQCIGNFRYDLAVEPDGLTSFNASQTTSEAALGDTRIYIDDPDWAFKVLADNTSELDNKLSRYHDYCFQCEFHSYCAGGWYHYRIAEPEDVRAWDSAECPGYKRLWSKVKDRFGEFDTRMNTHHEAMRAILKSPTDSVTSKQVHDEIAGQGLAFYAWLKQVENARVALNPGAQIGRPLMERIWAYQAVGATINLSCDDFGILSNDLKRLVIEHLVYGDTPALQLDPAMVWEWVRTSPDDQLATIVQETSLLAQGLQVKDKDLILAGHNTQLLRWVLSHPSPAGPPAGEHPEPEIKLVSMQLQREASLRSTKMRNPI
jgi:MoaA/NifB/PqqE/SkfB family radical SAM enzyme